MVNPYETTMDQKLRRLDKEPFSEVIRKTIRKFANGLKIKENLPPIRRINYIQRLRKVAKWTPDNFLDPGERILKRSLRTLQVMITLTGRDTPT